MTFTYRFFSFFSRFSEFIKKIELARDGTLILETSDNIPAKLFST